MDFIKDRNPRILTHLKTQFGEFPSYVKSASRSEHQSDTEALDSQLFASSTRKEFPLATPEQTFLSYGYYKVAGVSDPLVERRIKKAAAAHDITEDLLKIDSIVDGQVKSAAVQDTAQNFALSIDRGADGIQHYYPTVSYDHVTKSARDVANDFGKLPIEAFRVAAFNIVKALSTGLLFHSFRLLSVRTDKIVIWMWNLLYRHAGSVSVGLVRKQQLSIRIS